MSWDVLYFQAPNNRVGIYGEQTENAQQMQNTMGYPALPISMSKRFPHERLEQEEL